MKLARAKGTVTATAKDSSLTGKKLLLVDVEDGRGKVIESSVVAVDTCGAGVGDLVLVSFGSASRLPASTAGVVTDAAIVAVVEHVSL